MLEWLKKMAGRLFRKREASEPVVEQEEFDDPVQLAEEVQFEDAEAEDVEIEDAEVAPQSVEDAPAEAWPEFPAWPEFQLEIIEHEGYALDLSDPPNLWTGRGVTRQGDSLLGPPEADESRMVDPSRPGTPFLCYVTKDGGASGGEAAECTYTYTVKELDDTTILKTKSGGNWVDAEELTPQTPRLHYTAYWYAGEERLDADEESLGVTSRGAIAAYEGDVLRLLVCFGEIAKDTACE